MNVCVDRVCVCSKYTRSRVRSYDNILHTRSGDRVVYHAYIKSITCASDHVRVFCYTHLLSANSQTHTYTHKPGSCGVCVCRCRRPFVLSGCRRRRRRHSAMRILKAFEGYGAEQITANRLLMNIIDIVSMRCVLLHKECHKYRWNDTLARTRDQLYSHPLATALSKHSLTQTHTQFILLCQKISALPNDFCWTFAAAVRHI